MKKETKKEDSACPTCKGTGRVLTGHLSPVSVTCETCQGTGVKK